MGKSAKLKKRPTRKEKMGISKARLTSSSVNSSNPYQASSNPASSKARPPPRPASSSKAQSKADMEDDGDVDDDEDGGQEPLIGASRGDRMEDDQGDDVEVAGSGGGGAGGGRKKNLKAKVKAAKAEGKIAGGKIKRDYVDMFDGIKPRKKLR